MRFSRLVITLPLVVSSYSQAARAGAQLWSDEFKGDSLSSAGTAISSALLSPPTFTVVRQVLFPGAVASSW